ncbi:MAG: hypothetical protein OEM23_04135, partial [Gemmatimonadota bacterium]|nr:hypothetical protein [Gemmatimonadota bacterium]
MTSTNVRLGALFAVSFLALVTSAPAQTVRVVVAEENFRKEPAASSDNRLATLLRNAEIRVAEVRGRWIRGSIEGWIWNGSTETTDRDGFDLIVSRQGGENLRTAPDGSASRMAVLMRGMLLDSLETRGSWTRVRREAWIWSESTEVAEGSTGTPVPADSDSAVNPQPAPAMSERLIVGAAAAGLLLAPDGDTAAVVEAGTDLTVLSRQGGWTRVRLEG